MEAPETITDKKMLWLLDQLKRERTTLKLNIAGRNFEGISILLGTGTINGNLCLLMDFPAGAGLDILYAHGKKINVEFTDKNKIHYNFRSAVEEITPRNICVRMPKAINRIQRRKFFRVNPPIDIKVFIDEGRRFEFNVIDISEGGIQVSHPSAFHDENKFYQNAQKSLDIVYMEEGQMQTIKVKKAEIRRINKIFETGCYNYAFQFIDCGRQEENNIRNVIYMCQRRLLEKRQLQEKDGV